MVINLNLFIFMYIGIFILAPILILFYAPSHKKNIKSLILRLWALFYFILSALLTLFSVSITTTHIVFTLPHNHSFFEFNYADGLNVLNLIINLALTLPLGVICYYYYFFKTSSHAIISIPLKYNPCLIGLIYALSIELLQGILPTGRFFDVSDLFFDSIFPFLSFIICAIYNKIINLPLQSMQTLNFPLKKAKINPKY